METTLPKPKVSSKGKFGSIQVSREELKRKSHKGKPTPEFLKDIRKAIDAGVFRNIPPAE